MTGPLALGGSPPLEIPAGILGYILAADGAGNVTLQPGIPGLNPLSAAYSGGADPTAARDSFAAIQGSLNACAAGSFVTLPPGKFNISAQLTVYPGTSFVGPQGYRAAATTSSYLRPMAAFTGASAIAVAPGSPSVTIQNITVDGQSLPSGNTIDGIDVVGAAKYGSMFGIEAKNFGGYGIKIAAGGTGNPDGWHLREIQATGCGLAGLFWSYCVDSSMVTGHFDGNTGPGILLSNFNNTWFLGIKSQQNLNGIEFTGSFAKVSGSMVAVFTESNKNNGFWFHGVGNEGVLNLVGCQTHDDGTAGTSGSGYAGYNFNGVTGVDLQLSACANYVTTAGNGPDYGLLATNCTGKLAVSASSLLGSVAGYQNGGGNTAVKWDPTSSVSTGEGDSRTTTYPGASSSSSLAASAQFAPSDPGGTTSTTLVMMGLGSTCSYTPALTGKVQVSITAYAQVATATATLTAGCRYGTGTAPANGTAVSGTRFGASSDPSVRPASVGGPTALVFTGLITGLTAGVPIWIDVALLTASSSDQATIHAVSVTAAELPS